MSESPGEYRHLRKLNIAVVGSGVSGLSAAWLLSQRHTVTVFEADDRIGGHSHTIDVQVSTKSGQPAVNVPVDTGFIVSNTWTYPNFSALMDYLDQPMVDTEMTFSVSADQGRYEYSGEHLGTLMGRPAQWFQPKHWRMMGDLYRFYSNAEADAAVMPAGITLGDYLARKGYGDTFVRRHILPMAGAIWSATPDEIASYPFHAFVAFFANHKLFLLGKRPPWRTVKGGSRAYVNALVADGRFKVHTGAAIASIMRHESRGFAIRPAGGQVDVILAQGERHSFDHVVLATHADQALRLLARPTVLEQELLSPFTCSANTVYLHRDATQMPGTRRFWSAWNYREGGDKLTVTYWMNALQKLDSPENHFVSLNPLQAPAKVDARLHYRHPVFNAATLEAQRHLWQMQGMHNTWFCGAWFGAGFHEDGLQAGLAVAEQLGGLNRPWQVPEGASRIHVGPAPQLPHVLPLPASLAAE